MSLEQPVVGEVSVPAIEADGLEPGSYTAHRLVSPLVYQAWAFRLTLASNMQLHTISISQHAVVSSVLFLRVG